eukprot:TRINITY_DN42460_c0_g1_i1.p1 TRINITY_DN42460_c0_g1~~TRINITY_DN42460_c0_g1_i1.p1  ORF type:complete len:412 (+),score=42.32 TRINITY_DN42460_c0_g1_i1:132-1367(+)
MASKLRMLSAANLLLQLGLVNTIVLDTPPLFEITASSLYDAGLQHGRLARQRIKAYLALDEMMGYWRFAQGEGKLAYQALRRESTAAYPQYAKELEAIAKGANVSIDQLWSAILMIELGSLMSNVSADHCSDIFAVAPGGYQTGFYHGHNEDWSLDIAQHLYYIKYSAVKGADFESCAGLIYPGSLAGWSVAWNAHGIFTTVNTLRPRNIRIRGVTTAFIQREAICGLGKGRTLDQIVEGLRSHQWAYGASINIVDAKRKRMANMETWEDNSDCVHVTEAMSNYSHFNMYKHLGRDVDAPSNSTLHRQRRVDTLPAPKSTDDIISILSDKRDQQYPIFRNGDSGGSATMVSHVLDGDTGRLRIWCCQRLPSEEPPTYTWNISTFWESEPQSVLAVHPLGADVADNYTVLFL